MFVMVWNANENRNLKMQGYHSWMDVNSHLMETPPVDWPDRIVNLNDMKDEPVMFET